MHENSPLTNSLSRLYFRQCCPYWDGLVLAALLLAGCTQEEPIRRYQVSQAPAEKTEETVAAKPAPSTMSAMPPMHAAFRANERMLAAVIPLKGQAWFFKVTGSKDALADHAEAFQSLIKSLKFAEEKPQWQLPQGWREKPGTGMRLATLEMGPEDKPLQLSVIPLALAGMTEAECVLSNVNRWRGQMSLPPITAEQLKTETQQVRLDSATATLVDLLNATPADTGRTPKAGGGAAPGN